MFAHIKNVCSTKKNIYKYVYPDIKVMQPTNNNSNSVNNAQQHLPRAKLSFGQRLSDRIAEVGGSWAFIMSFGIFLLVWLAINTYFAFTTFDPYPYILLNLVLSCLAAVQAPIILMSQNRAAQRDRTKADRDFAVNRKAEREIANMQQDLDEIKELIVEHWKR